MRHLLISVILTIATQAQATPVYLRLDSRFPSGHYSRNWLESRTKKVQFQRWLRVETIDKAYGWVPEDHLLTAAKLSSEVLLTEDVPARLAPEMDAIYARPTIAKGTRALLLEVNGSWVRLLPFSTGDNQEAWVPTEAIKPYLQQKTAKAFVHTSAPVYVLPGPFARHSHQLREGIYAQVLRTLPGWIEIKSSSITGYIRSQDAWTWKDLEDRGARPALSLTSLRSAPLPFADLIRTLPLTARLKVIDAKTLRWGQVKISDLGEVWWPINEDFEEDRDPRLAASGAVSTAAGSTASTHGRLKLPTSDLFSRKIFDMAASPAIPSLKFVSAEGIFRTVDGQEWNKIPLFQNNNYPIAISNSGAVFIGPYVSDDHGETFQQWIRWDSLVATLKNQQTVSAPRLQILEIRPKDSSGRRVQLLLNTGHAEPARVVTDDQGLSWRAM